MGFPRSALLSLCFRAGFSASAPATKHDFIALSRPTPIYSSYNNELVKCLEDLREKREQVNKAILKEEKEKATIQKQVPQFTVRFVTGISLSAPTPPQSVFQTLPRSIFYLATLKNYFSSVNSSKR